MALVVGGPSIARRSWPERTARPHRHFFGVAVAARRWAARAPLSASC